MSPIPHRKPRLHGVAALGAVVALAALAGCVTRTREVVVERPQAPAVVVQQQPVAGNAPSVRAMPVRFASGVTSYCGKLRWKRYARSTLSRLMMAS